MQAREQHPFQLRFDPTDAWSRSLWRLVPSISMSKLSELVALRKNAAAVLVLGSGAATFSATMVLLLVMRRLCVARQQ